MQSISFMDVLITICVRLLEIMFALGMVFSVFAIAGGIIDFARTFANS